MCSDTIKKANEGLYNWLYKIQATCKKVVGPFHNYQTRELRWYIKLLASEKNGEDSFLQKTPIVHNLVCF